MFLIYTVLNAVTMGADFKLVFTKKSRAMLGNMGML